MNDRTCLARSVLDAIHLYRDDCVQFAVFYPLDGTIELGRAVAALVATYAPAGVLPGEGAKLWRRLVQSSTTPDPADYYRVFDELDTFERWVITHYAIGGNEAESKRQKAARRWLTGAGQLKVTPQRVLDRVGSEPRKATVITREARVANDHGRAILAGLRHLGFVRHVKGEGYVRSS